MTDRPTILLADDDLTITNALRPFLERVGFHVLAVINGADVLEKAQSHRPDLIVLDVLMPRMDVREVLRRLRRAGMQTPAILLTQVQRPADPASGAVSSVFEMLTFERQIKSLFESSRVGPYAYLLAPDGGAMLVMNTLKPMAVDLLALDGNVIHSFGTFLNNGSTNSMPSPLAWSPDGSLVAFTNLRRAYVAPRVSQKNISSGLVGVPPDTREVYLASDQSSTPWFLGIPQ